MTHPHETTSPDPRPVVILVEDLAHESYGHYSKTFAEVADGFVDAGCRVEVLVSSRWAADRCDRRFGLHPYGRISRSAFRLSTRVKWLIEWLDARGSWARRPGVVADRLRQWLRTVATVGAARALARRLDVEPVGIVVVWLGASLPLVERLAGTHRWILRKDTRQLGPSDRSPRIEDARVALAITDPEWGPTWSGRPVVVASLAVARIVDSDRLEARRRLGLDPEARIALMVGSGHSWQRPEVVLEALEDRADLDLVIIGKLAEREGIADGGWRRPPTLRGGYLSDEELDGHFAAADLVIISLAPGFPSDSGVLLDAASHGVPVVVSSPSLLARLVEAHGAGVLFEAGSPASLSRALDRVDHDACRRGILEMRDQLSAASIARQHLVAFEAMGWRPRSTSD